MHNFKSQVGPLLMVGLVPDLKQILRVPQAQVIADLSLHKGLFIG